MKLLRTLTVLSFAAAPLQAQAHFSILAGGVSANVSTATADQIPNKSSRTGFLAGVGASVSLGSRLSFGPELMYVQKGVKAVDNSNTIHEEVKVDYIELPLLFHLALSGGSMHPYLLAGGSVAMNLSCKLHFSGLGQDIKEDCSDEDADVSSSDYGAVVGAGVAFGRLHLSVRYDYGLKNINKNGTGNDDVKNRVLMGVVSFAM